MKDAGRAGWGTEVNEDVMCSVLLVDHRRGGMTAVAHFALVGQSHRRLSFKEAAQVLGIQQSAATLRYVRALKRLKALWQQMYPQEGTAP